MKTSVLPLVLSWFLAAMMAGPARGDTQADQLNPGATTEVSRFDLYEFQVEGNTVLDTQTIEKAVYPFLGPDKTIEDVESARKALEKVYHDRGFQTVLVDIPEQEVVDALVRLHVTEGSVDRLRISGSRYFSLGHIRAGVPALAEGSVPHMPSVQQQLAQLGDESADRKLTPILRAGSSPGKVEAEIRIDDQLPLHSSLEINGQNTEHTTRTRLVTALRYDNLWQRFHSASLQYQVSPQNSDQVQVWSGTYLLPVGWENSRLALYGIGISSDTDLGASVGGTDVVGNGTIFGARFVRPLTAEPNYYHSLVAGLDYKDFTQATELVGEDDSKIPISYLPFFVGYDGKWRTDRSLTLLSLGGHFAFAGLVGTDQEFERKRFKASASYFYVTADAKHEQMLPYGFMGAFRASGQVTDGPLISNEQFTAGGVRSVRGYYQVQQLGDDGVNLSVEFHSPQLLPMFPDVAQNLRLLGFFDWAYLWILDPLPGNASYYRLASTGVGLRMQLLKHWVGELDWGYPFYGQGTVVPGKQRIDFRMAYEF